MTGYEGKMIPEGEQLDELTQQEELTGMTEERLSSAESLLQEYKNAKANLENRIVENEQWYKLRHWEQLRKKKTDRVAGSAWLFNSLANKHADIMDNIPDCTILPREESDRTAAGQLSSIVPVVVERNDFEQAYSDAAWYKLKTGTGVYGVFWNSQKQNGLGDIDIKQIDILNLFWEPGIKDIQQSQNVFLVTLEDNNILESQYPQLKGKTGYGSTITVAKYIYDDAVDTSDKSAVVDWYYKTTNANGQHVLHYCKFCNHTILYASENDPMYSEIGFYNHGQYPFVFDVLFLEEGTPVGFGYLDIMKEPQIQIDALNSAIVRNAQIASTPRWFKRNDSQVNLEEFADWSNPFVGYSGTLDDTALIPIKISNLSSVYVSILNNKIEELKETSGNRDFAQGGTTSGVTAASAIAALQEAGSKLMRDMIQSSYRSYQKIIYLVIELIRQFYDEPRSFRILGQDGQEQFVQYTNDGISPMRQGNDFGLDFGTRMPIFDVKVRAHKKSSFSQLSQNELAKELYQLGVFNPQMSDQALALVEMMDFEGKDSVVRKIQQNGTLYQMVQQMAMQIQQLSAILDAEHGTNLSGTVPSGSDAKNPPDDSGGGVPQTDPLGRAMESANNTQATTARDRAQKAALPE